MPSGSHGGSGGSHFGGGGASSGGGWSGGSSGGWSSGSSRPPRPMNIWFFGRHYHISAGNSSKVSAFVPYIIICIFALFMSVLFLVSGNSQIEKIQVDRAYYLDMIENAENDSDYLKYGVVKDKFYEEDCKKWYFTYEIPTDDGGTLPGHTFYVYTMEEVNQYHIGDTLAFAVNSKIVTEDTDSVNMGYKDIPLENDGEYINARNMKAWSIVFICIASTLIVSLIVLTIKRIKKYAEKSAFAEKNDKNTTTDDEYTYCRYCGSRIRKEYDKCEHCGASVVKKK